ncbi:nuclear transport factor 2 family protein [Nocardia sp. NBC_01503]|uniref:nuclear transport factor 2 family protein n=1 Tax=Nocardia sp. NBC_01503 TaxID=2975997 RepID=UPI002E7C042C|nr:nuclear transport factor 2 family protein [Nocardia sp. NBC_01503]WTL31721.1 nuclear transport factor 2 family protein [Nocardia sp. NBC_01503]
MTDLQVLSDRLEISELITKLFVYCDQLRWADMTEEVLTEQVYFDSGFGGTPETVPTTDITAGWAEGLGALDAVHHQAGNHLIEITGDTARAHADAIAVHLKNDAANGTTRWFVGSYVLGFERTEKGWRINHFEYKLKVIDGNADLT